MAAYRLAVCHTRPLVVGEIMLGKNQIKIRSRCVQILSLNLVQILHVGTADRACETTERKKTSEIISATA